MRAEETIRARLSELDEVKASYLQYLQKRIAEEDWHGAWDACVNLSETSCEQDGLERALRAIQGEAKGPGDLARCGRCGYIYVGPWEAQTHLGNCPGRTP